MRHSEKHDDLLARIDEAIKNNPDFQSVLDIVAEAKELLKDTKGPGPRRLLVPYVNAPSLLERAWK